MSPVPSPFRTALARALNLRRAAPGSSVRQHTSQASKPQEAAAQALATAKRLLTPLSQRLGTMLGSYRQPLLYNAAVARELAKHVYHAERLQPPNLAAIRTAYASLWAQLSNTAALRQIVHNGDAARVGIYGLQAYGIFKVGEIIGRRSLVGYDLH